MVNYPYPVLSDGESSYKKGYYFSLEYVKGKVDGGIANFEFTVKMNSNRLNNLISSGDAKLLIKAQTGLIARAFEVDLNGESKIISISTGEIKENDNISFVAYIVTTKNITFNGSDEISDVYGADYKVQLEQYAVLAISNYEKLSYISGGNDFIQFKVMDQMKGKGFSINVDSGENYVNVNIGPKLNEAYGFVKNNKKDVCATFNNHLVFEVFVYILISVAQRYDDFKGKAWCESFAQLILQTCEIDTIEDYISRSKKPDEIDIGYVYEVAHLLINNQIEKSLILISENED